MSRLMNLSSGRTSFRRGALALFLAPAIVVLPLSAVLMLAFNLGLEGGCRVGSLDSPVTELALVWLVLNGATLLLGVPTWMLLRVAHCESRLTYVIAGLMEGLAGAFYIGYSNTGTIRFDQALAFCLLSLTGGAIGWAFWQIARDAREGSQPK